MKIKLTNKIKPNIFHGALASIYHCNALHIKYLPPPIFALYDKFKKIKEHNFDKINAINDNDFRHG